MSNLIESHKVLPLSTPIRLIDYCIGIFGTLQTKSSVKKAIKKEFLHINGVAANTSSLLHGGETIELFMPINPEYKGKIIKLEIIFEDEYLAMINKPPGIIVSGNKQKTITNLLPSNINKSNMSDAVRAQPVHRLDFATTGILMIGKTATSIRILNKMFEDKEVKKTYFAVSVGKMNSSGVISGDIEGKEAITNYTLIKSLESPKYKNLNLIKLEPLTGRRHQLRKHLYDIGNPILGDKDYYLEGMLLKGKGLYLHSYSLEFTHPFTSKRVCFYANLPDKFKKLFPKAAET